MEEIFKYYDEKDKELFESYRKRGYKIIPIFFNEGSFIAYTKNLNDEIIGGIGFIKQIQNFEDFKKMINSAEKWFKNEDVKRYFIPLDFNTWHNYRIISGNFENKLFPGEMEYDFSMNQWFYKIGLTIVERYYSYIVDDYKGVMDYLSPSLKKIKEEGIVLKKVKPDLGIIKSIYEISCNAFKEAFLFEEIQFDEFLKMNLNRIENGILILAFFQDNPVGFIYGYRWNDILIEKTVAVLKEYRRKFVGTALIYKMYEEGLEIGCKRFIHAFMREDISTHIFSKRFGKIYREYSLYGKELF